MVMNQHTISRFAIYVLAIVMGYFGIRHFLYPYDLVVKVPDFLPGGVVWVYFTGAAFILTALSFLTNVWVRASAYVLAVLLFSFVFTIHLPNYLETADRTYQTMALTNLLKDAALAAFALYIASNARHQRILEETDVEEEKESMRMEAEPV
jgi:putative oxidoreductase